MDAAVFQLTPPEPRFFPLSPGEATMPYHPKAPAREFDAAGSFQNALGHAIDSEHAKPDATTRATEARDAAEQLVSTAFVQPILSGLREMNNAAPPFAPTQAEKQFGPLLDAQLADRYVAGQNFPLVDRLAAQLYRPPAQNTSTAQSATPVLGPDPEPSKSEAQ